MEYEVVYGFANSDNGSPICAVLALEDQVRKLMKEGWKTQGGVSISIAPPHSHPNTEYKICVAQALIKED